MKTNDPGSKRRRCKSFKAKNDDFGRENGMQERWCVCVRQRKKKKEDKGRQRE